MNLIILVCGIILGILIRDIKFETIKIIEEIKKSNKNKEETKFFEPLSEKERFEKASNINELLNN